MQDIQLDDKKKAQLDGNIKKMLEGGANEDDIMQYASDFKNKFGQKKNPVGSPSSAIQLPLPNQKVSSVNQIGNALSGGVIQDFDETKVPKKENDYFKQVAVGIKPSAQGNVVERIYENPMGVEVLQVEPKKREIAPTQPVQKAETKDKPLRGVKPIAPTNSELNEQGWLLNMVSALDKGVYKTLGTTVQATGTALQGVTSKITGGTGEGFVSDALIKIGSTYNKYIDELTSQDESFKGSLSDQLGNALGYLAGLYMTGGLSASAKVAGSSLATRNAALVAAKTPPPLATVFKDFIKNTAAPTAIVGGLGMGQSEFDRAKQAGATDEQAFEAFWKNAATGSIMERLPVMHFLKRFNNATAGGVLNYIKTKGVAGLTGGVEEMTTEMLQQLYANKTAKDIYNTNQDLFEGVVGNGTIGFSVGFLLNAMGANAKILRKQGKVNEAKLVENQVKELQEKAKGVAPTNNAITTKIAVNGNEEGLQRTQAELDNDLQKGLISEEEYQEKAAIAQRAAEFNAKIPEYVQGINRAESIELINEREALQQELMQKEEQKKSIDVAYHKSIDESNKEVQKRIDEINNQLGELAKPEKNKVEEEITPPTDKQIEDDLKNNRLVTFEYNSESEIPDVFKDKVSSKGENNGVEFFRVTLPESVANYELNKLNKQDKEVVVQEEIQQPIEDKKADIEKRREQELKERVVYDVFPTVEDGEFKIIGDPNNRIYRINENTGRPQELDPSNGLWSNTALAPNLFMESTKRSGFEKLKENINAKYDAELNALGEQQIPDENIQQPIEEQGEIVEEVIVEDWSKDVESIEKNLKDKIVISPDGRSNNLWGIEELVPYEEKQEIMRLFIDGDYSKSVPISRIIAEAYNKAKSDNSNPKLVKAVEDLLGTPKNKVAEEEIQQPIEEGKEDKTGLVLYHGSPHSFENFDISKLGSGEGAQAFGYGLYFTNETDIAKGYANKLSSRKNFWDALIEGNNLSLSKEDYDFINNELDSLGFDGAKAEGADLGNILVDGKEEYSPQVLDAMSILFGKNAVDELSGYDLTKEQIDRLMSIKKKISDPQFYKVSVHKGKSPSEYDYIDWAVPLSESQRKKIGRDLPENISGESFYKSLVEELGSDKKTSEFLLSKGVDGITYKSNKGTGGKSGKGRNYVVFDSNSIEVEEINDVPQPKKEPKEIVEAVRVEQEPEAKPQKVFAEKDLDRAKAKKVHQRVREMEAPSDAAQIALRYIADGGNVSEAAINEVAGTVKRARLNTGAKDLKSNEAKSRDYYQKDGETLDELAHRLWENSSQEVSEIDIKDALMSVIGDYNTRLEAGTAYLEQYNAEYIQEKYYERLAEEREEEWKKEQDELERQLRTDVDEQIEGEASEEHINNLIKQYESEFKAENQQPKPASKADANKEIGGRASGKEDGNEKGKVGEQPIGEAEAKNVDNNPKEIIKKLKERKSDKAIHAEIFQKNGYNVFIYDNNKVLIDKTFKTHEEAKKYLNDWASQNGKENQLKYEYGTITDIAKLPYRQEITGNIPKDFIEQNKIKKESIAEAKPKQEDVEPKQKEEKKEEPKKDNLADKARNKAAKLRSGEENVLPDWLRADLPKGTKKQGASINEAYAAALETFADVYEKAQDFKKAVDEAFKKLSDWYNENNIDFDEKDLKEKFEAEMQGKKQDDADQERRFTKQMLATESLLPKAEITKTLEYVKQSNALSIEQATKIIDEIGVDEAFGLVVSGSDINGGVRGVLGQMLISKYNNLSKVAKTEADKEYYWDKTIEVADYVTKVLATEAGRMIQSFALWGRLTPEALIRSAIKDLQRQGEVFKKKAKKDVDNIGNKLAKANEEAVDEVLESNGLNAAIDNAEKKTKSKAAQKIKKIQDKRKSIIDKYKGKGGITFTSGGLTKEGIEFVGEMAKTYIEEGIANIQLMVEKIAENIKEISGKDATEDMLKQVKEIAEKKLSSSDIRLISKGLNDMKVKISEVVKKHFTEVESVKTTLAEKLVEEAGLEGEEATELANKIKDAFDRVATTKKNKILEDELERLKRAARKLNGTKEVTAKQLHDDIIRLTNLGGFNNTELLDLLAAKVGTGKLTQQEGARLQFLAERVRQAPEGSPKNDAIQDLLNYQANLKGASAGELSQAVWYASLLGGYKTQIKNIVANFFNTAVLTFTNIVENPKATKEILGGLARGWARGITEARHTLSTGKSPIHILKIEASNILERKRFKGKYNPMNVLKYVSRAMVAADVFAYQGLKESRSYQLAYAEAVKMKKKDALGESVWRIVNDKLLNTKERKAQAELIIEAEGLTGNEAKRRMYELMEQSRPEKMQDDSYNYAARGTYNYPPEGVLGALNNAISVALDIPIAGVKPLRFLVPFTRVLTNVANGALDFEPITSTRRAIRGKVGFEAFNSFSPTKGTYREMTPEEQKTQYVKAAIGITALSLFYALSKMEDDEGEPLIEITGAGSSDYNKTNALRQRGWKPYSIKIGDKYYSYQLTPLILTLGWIGSLNDFEKYDAKDDTEVLEKMSQTAFRLQDIITDMSFMSSTADIFDNFFDNSRTRGKKVGDYLENLGKSSIPFMQPISQVSQTVQTYMGANQKETSKLGYDLVKDIPIARNYLYDKVNVLGEPIKLEKGIGELLVSTKKSSKAWDLLEKNGVFIAPIKRKTVMFYDTEKGMDLPASDEQFYNFSRLRGSLIKDWIEDLEDEGLYVIEDDAMVWKDWKQLNSGKYKKDVDSYIEDGTIKATEAAKETVLLNNKNEVDAAYWQRLKDKVKNENEKLKRYQQ